MLRPSQVQFYAKKAENKNYRFRSWLKMHADPDDLDAQFLLLHKELIYRQAGQNGKSAFFSGGGCCMPGCL